MCLNQTSSPLLNFTSPSSANSRSSMPSHPAPQAFHLAATRPATRQEHLVYATPLDKSRTTSSRLHLRLHTTVRIILIHLGKMLGWGSLSPESAARRGLEGATSGSYRAEHPEEFDLILRWRLAVPL